VGQEIPDLSEETLSSYFGKKMADGRIAIARRGRRDVCGVRWSDYAPAWLARPPIASSTSLAVFLLHAIAIALYRKHLTRVLLS
jgi:hypothetical protein